MSSSESESDDLKLHSAIDHDFINEILTQANSSSKSRLPSLRPKEKNNCKNELNVTCGFQKHVAKHLDAIIQRSIKEVKDSNSTSSVATKETFGGIKLFSHSKSLITKRDLETGLQEKLTSFKRRKRGLIKSSSSDDESDELQRISSAAVSPEWVLQKRGAYGKCEKGKVIRLKDPGNGQLIVVASTE